MAPRRLLLVGEGNFSFAVAVSETLDPSTSLTATCLQRPADLTPDPVARENLQRLRERGTKIRFGVDCTQLADAFELHEREFDRICFNFPHCGRKAGVARNRDLLAKFFQRSQDKSFHIEGALNHIFTRSLPFEGSQPRIFKIKLDDRWFSFPEPEALVGKLNREKPVFSLPGTVTFYQLPFGLIF
uniref:25S rRNA (uridine-N(3))-methyltransferase BMT5-like domain-containing protein n=1 Tax=Molossus molossus TaxID=27622 RepID=A0A7J8ERG8_MOLMO|nr:hypothetical protein HJG59_008631 [Molossus molossus]